MFGRVLGRCPRLDDAQRTDLTQVEILMANEGNLKVTIVGDLANVPQIPSAVLRLRKCDETLQFVYDVLGALATPHRILAPAGSSATVPGIRKISPPKDEEYGEGWDYTGRSALRLAEEALAPAT